MGSQGQNHLAGGQWVKAEPPVETLTDPERENSTQKDLLKMSLQIARVEIPGEVTGGDESKYLSCLQIF